MKTAMCLAALVMAASTSGAQAVKSVVTTLTPTSIHVGETAQGTTKQTLANGKPGNRLINWITSNPAIATVNSSGVITGIGVGTATITGGTLSGAGGGGVGGAAVITVLATIPQTPPPPVVATVLVSINPSVVTVGKTAQATATARDASGDVITGRSVVWSSSATTIASISPTGVITAVKAGQASISALVDSKVTSSSTVLAVDPIPIDTTTPPLPSPGHPHEPPNFSSLSPTLTGDDVPTQNGDGSTPPIGWLGRGLTSVVDSSFPGGPQKTLNTFFPPGMIGGGGPSAAWTYQRNVNAQNWPLGVPPRHSTAIYISWYHKFSPDFPINHVANKMLYPESWKPSDGGNTNVQAGIIVSAPADSVGDDGHVYGNYFTQYNALIYPQVGLQGPVMVDGVDYSAQGGVGLFGWASPRSKMFTVKRGVWHHWEVLLELNQPGQQDGSAQVWVDGILTVDVVHRIRFLLAENEEWSWLNYNTVYGGGGSVPNDGIGGYHRIRDLYVSGTTVDHARINYGTTPTARIARPKGTDVVVMPKGALESPTQSRPR